MARALIDIGFDSAGIIENKHPALSPPRADASSPRKETVRASSDHVAGPRWNDVLHRGSYGALLLGLRRIRSRPGLGGAVGRNALGEKKLRMSEMSGRRKRW